MLEFLWNSLPPEIRKGKKGKQNRMSSRQRCQILLKKKQDGETVDEFFGNHKTPHSLYLCVFI